MRRTKRRRPVNLDRCSVNCLLSDSSVEDDELDRSVDDQEVDADVDNETPALVEVMSCSSSFSDCSLPCHELVTFSSPSQLAKGRVKVPGAEIRGFFFSITVQIQLFRTFRIHLSGFQRRSWAGGSIRLATIHQRYRQTDRTGQRSRSIGRTVYL